MSLFEMYLEPMSYIQYQIEITKLFSTKLKISLNIWHLNWNLLYSIFLLAQLIDVYWQGCMCTHHILLGCYCSLNLRYKVVISSLLFYCICSDFISEAFLSTFFMRFIVSTLWIKYHTTFTPWILPYNKFCRPDASDVLAFS